MTVDPARTELTLPNDPRLMQAVGAVVAQAAGRAGLAESAREGFAEAAIEACRNRFSAIRNGRDATTRLQVSVVSFPDRIEVAIENIGGTTPPEDVDALRKIRQHAAVNHVAHEAHEGRVRTTLIKYFRGETSGRLN